MKRDIGTREKGVRAIGEAINYFVRNGYEVCLPVGDKRHYDFLVERRGVVEKVQVKFAGFSKRKGKCAAGLRITGGNQSFNYAKKYRDDAFDLLFLYTARSEKYLLPWKEVKCRNEISIENRKYRRYKVN